MNTMTEIVEELKNIISTEIKGNEGRERKIKDADVAKALGVNSQLLATAKNRGKILFEQIAEFCAGKGICINTLLFGQSTESLVAPTNKYLLYKYCLFN